MKQSLPYESKHRIMCLIAHLPLSVLYLVSDFAYVILYYVWHYRRSVVRQNLQNAFPEKDIDEIRHIERRFYHNLTDVFVEAFKTLGMSADDMSRHVSVENAHLVEHYASEGYNVLAMTGHLGNWEWAQQISRSYRKPELTTELYKHLSSRYFGSLMYRVRSHWDTEQIEMHSAVRRLMQLNREGRLFLCGFISDQRPDITPRGKLTFMNQETTFVPGAEEIARRINAKLVYLDQRRVKRGKYVLTFREILPKDDSLPYPMTYRFYEMLEDSINRQPDIWLWSHKRWS